MPRIYERALGEDLNLGVGTAQVTNPGGGSLNGTQVSLTTFAIAGADGSKTTATWNPGSVGSLQSVATTVTVNGAALGDFVLASFSLDLSGLILDWQVKSSNTVEITLFNPTTSAIDLASGTLAVLVFRVR